MADNIKFCDIEDRIIEALSAQGVDWVKYTLLEGFISPSCGTQLLEEITLGGPNIPMIVLVEEKGKIELYALKSLLPDLW